MKFKMLVEDNDYCQVYVGFDGTGDPKDIHDITGVEIKYKKVSSSCLGHSIGEVDDFPVKQL
jgi:hypothetical protein